MHLCHAHFQNNTDWLVTIAEALIYTYETTDMYSAQRTQFYHLVCLVMHFCCTNMPTYQSIDCIIVNCWYKLIKCLQTYYKHLTHFKSHKVMKVSILLCIFGTFAMCAQWDGWSSTLNWDKGNYNMIFLVSLVVLACGNYVDDITWATYFIKHNYVYTREYDLNMISVLCLLNHARE